jgi:hypothetical protein
MRTSENGLPLPDSGQGFCTLCAMGVKGLANAALRGQDQSGENITREVLAALEQAELHEAVAIAMTTAFGGQPMFVPLCWHHMMGVDTKPQAVALPSDIERAAFGHGKLPPGVKLLGGPVHGSRKTS